MVSLSNLWGKTPETRSKNKQMLLGGIATSLIYYGNMMAEEQVGYPAELKQQIDPHLPNYGELIAGVAPPLALYTIVKFGKKKRLESIADGSIMFGLPNIAARIIVQTATAEGKAVAPAVRFSSPMSFNNSRSFSKYIPSNSTSQVAATSGLSKYTLTS